VGGLRHPLRHPPPAPDPCRFRPRTGSGLVPRAGSGRLYRLIRPRLPRGDEGLAPSARLAWTPDGPRCRNPHPLALDRVHWRRLRLRHTRRPALPDPQSHRPRPWRRKLATSWIGRRLGAVVAREGRADHRLATRQHGLPRRLVAAYGAAFWQPCQRHSPVGGAKSRAWRVRHLGQGHRRRRYLQYIQVSTRCRYACRRSLARSGTGRDHPSPVADESRRKHREPPAKTWPRPHADRPGDGVRPRRTLRPPQASADPAARPPPD